MEVFDSRRTLFLGLGLAMIRLALEGKRNWDGDCGDPGVVGVLLRLSFLLESPGGAFATLTPRPHPSSIQSGPVVMGPSHVYLLKLSQVILMH